LFFSEMSTNSFPVLLAMRELFSMLLTDMASNGDTFDYRIENLRLLCPNCNSQQPTFAGRNKGRYRSTF
jgi:hypothetical protein